QSVVLGTSFFNAVSAQLTPVSPASMNPFVQDNLAIDDNIADALAIVKWVRVGGTIDNMLRVKDRDIREFAGLKQTAIAQVNFGSIERSHLSHSVLKLQEATFAHVNTQNTRKSPKIARMRMTT